MKITFINRLPENANHSPRILFSHDFPHSDSLPIEQRTKSSSHNSSLDFDFSIPVGVSFGESSWSAEEFFCDGKILPREIKKRSENDEPGSPKPETNMIRDVKPVLEIEEIGGREDEVKLPLLGNSSTCSKSKQTRAENMKLHVSSSSSSSYHSFQKPPLKKNHGGYSYRGNRGGIRVNSILDVVPSENLFGLGSINFGGERKRNKKRK